MLTAWYIGNHDKDGFAARLGYATIRFGQTRQMFGNATHCEAILKKGADGTHTIASASLRDGGVRIKQTALNPEHWIILDVPLMDVEVAHAWFLNNEGTNYSIIGAASSASLFVNVVLNIVGTDPKDIGQWCSRSLGESGKVVGASELSVAELMGLIWNLPGTVDVTSEFFGITS